MPQPNTFIKEASLAPMLANMSRRSLLRGVGAVGLAGGLASLLTACGGDGDAESADTDDPASSTGGTTESSDASETAPAASGGTATLAVDSTSAIFDPAYYTSLGDWMVVDAVCRGLTKIDFVSTEPQPDLAESWTTSDDAIEWVFTLRQGVQMHDGNELTTADVVRSFQRQWDENDPTLPEGATRQLAGVGRNVEQMEAVDDYTLRLVLIQPDKLLPAKLSDTGGRILSAAAIEAQGTEIGRAPVGSGPFKFVSATSGQSVVLEAFDDFVDGRPSIDRLVFQQVQDQSTVINSLLSGDVSATQFTPFSALEQLRNDPAVTVHDTPFGADAIMMMDCRKPALAELEVRQAINLAIDREALISNAFFGAAVEPKGYMIPPAQICHDESLADLSIRDVERAKELMEAAGATGRTIHLWAASDSWHPAAMQIIEQNLIEIGFQVETESIDPASYFGRLMGSEDSGHELMIWERNSYVPDPANMAGGLTTPDGVYGDFTSGWGTVYPEDEIAYYTERAVAAANADTVEERQAIYTEFQRRFAEEVMVVAMLACFTNPVVTGANVQGLNTAALSAHRCYPEGTTLS